MYPPYLGRLEAIKLVKDLKIFSPCLNRIIVPEINSLIIHIKTKVHIKKLTNGYILVIPKTNSRLASNTEIIVGVRVASNKVFAEEFLHGNNGPIPIRASKVSSKGPLI